MEDRLDLEDASEQVKAAVSAAEEAVGETARLENDPAFDRTVAAELCGRLMLTGRDAGRLIAGPESGPMR